MRGVYGGCTGAHVMLTMAGERAQQVPEEDEGADGRGVAEDSEVDDDDKVRLGMCMGSC